MRIISKKKIRDFIEANAQAKLPLVDWYTKMKNTKIFNLSELKKIFNSVDCANGYTIFDIGGNNYRLVTAIHYNVQHCYIRAIWTHSEYSKAYNQLKIKRGNL